MGRRLMPMQKDYDDRERRGRSHRFLSAAVIFLNQYGVLLVLAIHLS
jgi:hypothetical protein